jgi:beta-galactosidase
LALYFGLSAFGLKAQTRQIISLNTNWKTVAEDNSNKTYNGFEQATFTDVKWKTVNVPHNWDDYEGYRR